MGAENLGTTGIFFSCSLYTLSVLLCPGCAFCPYCTTHTTQTSMPPVGFELAIPAIHWPQTGIRSPDRSARSESLYRLRYPGPPMDVRLSVVRPYSFVQQVYWENRWFEINFEIHWRPYVISCLLPLHLEGALRSQRTGDRRLSRVRILKLRSQEICMLNMRTRGTFEILVPIYQTLRRHIPQYFFQGEHK